MKPHSEDLLERLIFELGVATAEAESGRLPDADLRARMAALCRKWREEIETLTDAAADPDVRVASKAIATQKENAELRKELEAAQQETGALKAENIRLQEQLAQVQKKPPPPPAQQKPADKAAEKPKESSEFMEAMKDVKRL